MRGGAPYLSGVLPLECAGIMLQDFQAGNLAGGAREVEPASVAGSWLPERCIGLGRGERLPAPVAFVILLAIILVDYFELVHSTRYIVQGTRYDVCMHILCTLYIVYIQVVHRT